MTDSRTLAEELAAAYASKTLVPPPTTREGGLDLATAYAVERELVRMRSLQGRHTVGVKVGFANKAMWRVLKLDTLVWAHMYDDTVRYANSDNGAEVSIGKMVQPKIEPELVFKLRTAVPDGADAAGALGAVEWIALGFEIIDSVYPDWKFTPVDFVASYGLHAGLVVGSPSPLSGDVAADVEKLAAFTFALKRNGEAIAKGSGRNSLKNPAACLAELAAAMARAGVPLSAGGLVSSGTLTEAQLLAVGENYSIEDVDGIGLQGPAVRIVD